TRWGACATRAAPSPSPGPSSACWPRATAPPACACWSRSTRRWPARRAGSTSAPCGPASGSRTGARCASTTTPPWPRSGAPSFLAHERIAPVPRGGEGLLDRARARPAHEVELGAGLVVRARGPRPPERLLAHHRPRRLVVDVEVAGGVAQGGGGLAHGAPVL